MKRRFRIGKSSAAFIVLMVLVLAATHPVQAQSSAQAQTAIDRGYASVLSAEQAGGNVTLLVEKLNTAISLVQQADAVNSTDPARAQALYSEAASIASNVTQSAPAVAAAGRASVAAAQFSLIVETIALGALAVVGYLFIPRLFWRFWLRTHRGWRLKKA